MRRKLWFSSPSGFNDPFDCAIFDYVEELRRSGQRARNKFLSRPRIVRGSKQDGFDVEDRLRRLNNSYLIGENKKQQDLQQSSQKDQENIQSFFYSIGILSLSESPRNILMWSHYAKHHTGICFEFERQDGNSLGVNAQPVLYSRKRDPDALSDKQLTANLLFQKFSGWRYEREWRLVENHGNQLYDFPGRLVSVICGATMLKQSISKLEEIIDLLNANSLIPIFLKFARMTNNAYTISIKPTWEK